MQAFVRKDKLDKHQAGVHAESTKIKCQCPQCKDSVERYQIVFSLLIGYKGTIYPSTSCGYTVVASSELLPLSLSAPIVVRCGPASASRMLSALSTLRPVSSSISALTGMKYSHAIKWVYLFSNWFIFSITIIDQTERNIDSTWVSVILEIEICLLNFQTVRVLMDALLYFSEWMTLDWMLIWAIICNPLAFEHSWLNIL